MRIAEYVIRSQEQGYTLLTKLTDPFLITMNTIVVINCVEFVKIVVIHARENYTNVCAPNNLPCPAESPTTLKIRCRQAFKAWSRHPFALGENEIAWASLHWTFKLRYIRQCTLRMPGSAYWTYYLSREGRPTLRGESRPYFQSWGLLSKHWHPISANPTRL